MVVASAGTDAAANNRAKVLLSVRNIHKKFGGTYAL
jgi:hypothetical protein